MHTMAPEQSPTSLIEQLDERAIAAWYCDDGNFSGHYARWGNGKAVIYNKSLERC